MGSIARRGSYTDGEVHKSHVSSTLISERRWQNRRQRTAVVASRQNQCRNPRRRPSLHAEDHEQPHSDVPRSGMDNLGRTDRDRPRPTDFGPNRTGPIRSVRLGPTVPDGPIGPVHLDLWDRLDRSLCSMITCLIRKFNVYYQTTLYLFATSKHIG